MIDKSFDSGKNGKTHEHHNERHHEITVESVNRHRKSERSISGEHSHFDDISEPKLREAKITFLRQHEYIRKRQQERINQRNCNECSSDLKSSPGY